MTRRLSLWLLVSLTLHAGLVALLAALVELSPQPLPMLFVDLVHGLLTGRGAASADSGAGGDGAGAPAGRRPTPIPGPVRRTPQAMAPPPKAGIPAAASRGPAGPFAASAPAPVESGGAAPLAAPPEAPPLPDLVVPAPAVALAPRVVPERGGPRSEPPLTPLPAASPAPAAMPGSAAAPGAPAVTLAPRSAGAGEGSRAARGGASGDGGRRPGSGARGGAGGGGGGPGVGGRASAFAAPGEGGASGLEYDHYVTLLRRRVQAALAYPAAARRREMTGIVEIEVDVQATGAIGEVRVASPSAHRLLDEAALEAARTVDRVPFPPDVHPRPLRVRLPVVFDLR